MVNRKMNLVAFVFASGVAVLTLCTPTALAVQSSTSEGYTTNTQLSDGALVSLQSANYQAVEMATTSNRDLLAGVAVKPEQALVAIADGSNRTQIVSSGLASVQISTANGDVKSGDYLTVSPISGVAMKATTFGKVLGIAQQDFDSQPNAGKAPVELTNNNGSKQTVQVGKLIVKIAIQDWSPSGQPNSPILNNLRNFFSNAAGKPVSNTQALISIGIIVLAILASGTILYSAVSSSIHSIGRNPLSKGIIRRSLFVMIALSAIVIAGAGLAVNLILGG